MSTIIHRVLSRILAYALLVVIGYPAPLYAALTDLADQPFAVPAQNVKPNIMLLLDDSGSMAWQFLPDYLGRGMGNNNQLCFDSMDGDNTITIPTSTSPLTSANLHNCENGDPILTTSQINYIYYNPEVRYFPPLNYDGSSKPIMNAANTTNWTLVPTDGVSSTGVTTMQHDLSNQASGSNTAAVATMNLASNFPDRVWCTSTSASATDTTNCKTNNSSYVYPDGTYGYGTNSSGSVKYRYGAAYYYRLTATEYCSATTMITDSSTSPVYDECIAATAPSGIYTIPAPVRYCTDSTFKYCYSKYGTFTVRGTSRTYTYPKYLGTTQAVSGGATASATLTVTNPQPDSYAGSITALVVNGANILSGTVSEPAGFSGSTAATDIKNALSTSSGLTATVSGNQITFTTTAKTSALNGMTFTPSFGTVTFTPATATITFSGVKNGDGIKAVTAGGTSLISATVSCSSCGNNSVTRTNALATALASAIMSGTSGYTAVVTTSATSTFGSGSQVVITVTAPSNTGWDLNGTSLSVAKVSGSNLTLSGNPSTFSGGITAGDIAFTATAFSGGADVATNTHKNVGNFTRANIVPYADTAQTIPSTFIRYPGRTDCAGTSCTYDEEMTNFANWFAYYRARLQMAKTSVGRAFNNLNSLYRVGYISINPMTSGTIDSTRFLAIDDFASAAGGQKDLWYQRLYGADINGSTPLRIALSRVGRYYGNVTTGINAGMPASPITYSCQSNYTVLVTDGYWNQGNGYDLAGNAIGNYDNTDSGYSKRIDGAYDGNLLPNTTAGSSPGGKGTLADVAMYYYMTDLRSDLPDYVPTTATDSAPHQHMDTYTVGLGLAGTLTYDPDYATESASRPGDFFNIKQGTLNWPSPQADSETALDDLWHAAVNSRGAFTSARDPISLGGAIANMLAAVQSRVAAGAAAATSNLNPVAGDNWAFTAQYKTVEWSGDLIARTIDLSTGDTGVALWSAQAQLDRRNFTDRHILTYDPTDTTATGGQNGNRLKSFCWPGAYATGLYPGCNDGAELSSTDMANFNPLTLPQAGPWPTDGSGRNVSATAQNLVDWLRGDPSNETTGGSATTDLYRARTHVLGDIVNAQPAYLKTAPFLYNTGSFVGTDPYYPDFKTSMQTRIGTAFAASNDGMLHAFETDPDGNPYYQDAGVSTLATNDDHFTGSLSTDPAIGEGAERWAYVPALVVPSLQNLASSPYSHQYFVDGSPAIGDVCFGHTATAKCSSASNWHSILVAGLNKGGRGFYALDVTDPAHPKGLWEFGVSSTCLTDADIAGTTAYYADCNVGESYGNPLIVKRPSDDRWVVLVTSGYNNVNPGDGMGYLYVLDAQSGRILQRFATGKGCDGVSTTSPCVAGTPDPSGFARINAWTDNGIYDNLALTVYGGDLWGNLYRIQLDGSNTNVPAGSVTRLAHLRDSSGNQQPITSKPELGDVGGNRVVYVGTGRLLGNTDITNTQQQTVWAIKDPMNSAPTTSSVWPLIRTSGAMVQQTLVVSATDPTVRTVSSPQPVDWSTKAGWMVDLPDSGERVNVDPQLQLGTLIMPSNVPTTDACTAGGYSWVNYFDMKTGGYVAGATNGMVSTKVSSSLVVGINTVELPGGTVKTIVTTADNTRIAQTPPISPPSISGRRVSWRELITE